MPQIQAVNPETATGKTKELLDGVKKRMGMAPNLMRTMANSPAVLEGLVRFQSALASGSLSAPLREQIALTVAELNGCTYCLAAHSAGGKMVGLNSKELADARTGRSADGKTDAALQFAQAIVQERGWVGDEALARVREAGYSDGDITEIIAVVSLNIFTNYFNHVAGTDIDFPEAPALAA